MSLSPEIFKLNISRSPFLKVAPLLLWLLAIFVPVFVGRHIFIDSIKQQHEQIRSMGRHQLMTRARELETRLDPEKIIRQELDLRQLNDAYAKKFYDGDNTQLTRIEMVKALPAFNADLKKNLARFSTYLEQKNGINPIFIAALNVDPDKCGLYINDGKGHSEQLLPLYKNEFSQLCHFLNQRSLYMENEPIEYRRYAKSTFLNDFLGTFDQIGTHFWVLHNSFSCRYMERLYMINVRAAAEKGQGNNFIIGILASHLSQRNILKRICQKATNDEMKVSFGNSTAHDLPMFTEENGTLSLIIKLPEKFQIVFRNQNDRETGPKRLAIRLTIDTNRIEGAFKTRITLLNLGLYLALSLSFLLAIGTSLGQLNLRANLAKLVTAAFFVSMFFPLSGLAWLGVSNTQISRDVEAQQIIQALQQKLKEAELAFTLQRNRQQLLMLYLSQIIQNISPDRWGNYVKKFFANDNSTIFKSHFNNFYLLSSRDQEFFRGQLPVERFRQNELPSLLSGPARRVLVQTGAFAHLSESSRQKILQMADFSTGIMEQLIDNELISDLFSHPGENVDATVLSRRDSYLVYFLQAASKTIGLLCFVTNNYLTAQIIDELNAQGSFKNQFEQNGYHVTLQFFVINEFQERQLTERVNPYSEETRSMVSLETANAIYINSDANQINNLHLQPPHIIVTDTILDRYIFAVAYAAAPRNSAFGIAGPVLLAILALATCMMLAGGVSRMLLIPVPPFLAAFREIENNRYDWNLSLHTGDEFDMLATSVNAMKISLHERRKMMQLVSQTAIEAVQADVNRPSEARRRKASILFSDIRGFTTISENHSAEEVVAMLNSYFTIMCPVIEKHGGFIDKLIGDAIQAVFFGDDDQERVLNTARAAIEIRKRLADFNTARAEKNLFAINNGIGIASGVVTTGLIGSKTGKLEAAVIGEPLQLAAMLESLSKHALRTQIIIDTASRSAIINFASIDSITISQAEAEQVTPVYELLKIF